MAPFKDGPCGVGEAFKAFLALVVAYAITASAPDANTSAGATWTCYSIWPAMLSKYLSTSVSIIYYVKDRFFHRGLPPYEGYPIVH